MFRDGKMQGSGRNMDDDEEEMTKAEKTEVEKIAYTYQSEKRFHAFVVNEKHLKEKTVIFIDALVNMGFNKMKEEYWINEEGKCFPWVYRYESAVKDEASVTLLNPGVPVQLDEDNDQLILGQSWKLMLQLKKAGKGEEKCFDYMSAFQNQVWYMQGWDCSQLVSSNHNASLVTMQGPLC